METAPHAPPADLESIQPEADPSNEPGELDADFDPKIIEEDARKYFDQADVSQAGPKSEQEIQFYKYVKASFQVKSEITRVKDQFKAIINGLEARLKGIEFVYSGPAADFVRQQIEGKKTKSIKTPWGTAGFRKNNAKLVVTDEAKLIAAAQRDEDLNDVIEPTWRVVMSKLSEHFKSTGDVPSGCEVTPEFEKFYVK